MEQSEGEWKLEGKGGVRKEERQVSVEEKGVCKRWSAKVEEGGGRD